MWPRWFLMVAGARPLSANTSRFMHYDDVTVCEGVDDTCGRTSARHSGPSDGWHFFLRPLNVSASTLLFAQGT